MLRSLLRLSGAIAFTMVLVPAVPSAAPGPGLAYDEIVRVLVNASPPPPGGFQTDLATLSAAPATPTPAPRRGIGIGAIAGAVLGGGGAGGIAGNVAGVVASDALENALDAQLGATFSGLAATLGSFLQPHHLRYAYLNGWERVDDLTRQTATIRKCDVGQVLTLDLARKTYNVYDPSAEPTPAAAPAPATRARPRSAPPTSAPPGTAVAQMSLQNRALGPASIDGQNTTGYASTASFAMTQATGSCRNGGAAISTTEYLAPLSRPAVTSCPVRRSEPVPETPEEVVAPPPSGGCRPTFSSQISGPPIPTGRLSMYTLVTMSGSNGASPAPAASGAGGVGFLTERGNVKILGSGDATLFDIPAGFVKATP